ncbi:bHLH-MYC_N domain-containing protein [Cephalotus follicularis]|uniref:BHLH-MYC_N domain-containing protein n=1 Tax=Cephalotus follicularis TaxID=3775 RepID=A0A1Q3AT05_CEPFO|nr:bHLH-MYC_N domain-containing protein [Cephalotus follicularis]
MGTHLHQLLKSLCSNTVWNYAVFWKLKHRSRLVLTWEDAYYDICDQYDPSAYKETPESLLAGLSSHDPLGLAVAKMSYQVYSLGEGIVGQVAVTGKHQWISADATNPWSSFQLCEGWQSQFLAGIKTIAVVAVVPHGVVQLGSSNKLVEDMKVVTHIRDAFFALQDSSVEHISALQCSSKSSLCLTDLPTKSLVSKVNPDCLHNLDNAMNSDVPTVLLSEFPYIKKYGDSTCNFPLSGEDHRKSGSDEGHKLLHPESNMINGDHQSQVGILTNNRMLQGQTSGQKNSEMGSVSLHSNDLDSINLYSIALQSEEFGDNQLFSSSNLIHPALCERVKLDGLDWYIKGKCHTHESSEIQLQKNLQKKLDNPAKFSQLGSSNSSLKFLAGCELHEALGPALLKRCVYSDWEAKNIEAGETVEMPEGMTSSHLTFESGPENLLEAVVANVCHSSSDVKSEGSFCKSVPSLLTTEKMPDHCSQTKHTVNSVDYSINQASFVEEDRQHYSNSSEICGAMSSRGFSSNCPSTCSEQLERSLEPARNNRKRSRPGENCRPRPRDRQLIQDRIKELRELVPNGSKCSIDSLLERTIKHMVFLQSITKYADKLSECAESKMHQKGTSMSGSSNCEQGSSWAVEVGSHLKVCSIVVENLNKNGQILVEMLCEECCHFLEIAEAIRSLGLTILKGVTEAHGEKTWICFVVEGQNRTMHRMDILWSLVQILQPKTTR